MSQEFVNDLFFQALKIGLLVSAPLLLSGLIVGLVVGMLQSASQIHEMTLVLIPKALAVGLALLVFFPWMMEMLLDFTRGLFMGLHTSVH